MAQPEDLQGSINNILSGQGRAGERGGARDISPARPHFSEFVPEHLEQATELATHFMQIADQEGLEAAVNAIREAQESGRYLPGLVQYALKLFLTHHPTARDALRLPPLELRQPNLVRPSTPAAPPSDETEGSRAVPEVGGSTPPEDRLDFWREDPLINEHHEHWHIVYPTRGRPGQQREIGDRHGELFAYMHEQMLARYDAERLGVGLERVEPFSDYQAEAPQGYDPGPLELWDGGQWYSFRARPAGASWSDMQSPFDTRPGAKIETQALFYQRLTQAGRDGAYQVNGTSIPVKGDNLGNTEEANILTVDATNATYGNHHNDGHIHFMYFDNQQPYGVMSSTATAVRDPIFFRWHKNVDSVFQAFQETLPPYDFSDAPPVRVQDIILVSQAGFPSGADGEAIGAEAFGGARWGNAVTAATKIALTGGRILVPTDELLTEMLQRSLQIQDEQGNPTEESITYLSHDDFYYFIRVENQSKQPRSVTVRIFIAPESERDDRTSWIEMDRFLYNIDAGAKAVIFRPADQASVIRKPALRPQDLTGGDEPSSRTDQQSWCDCGWPYTLLLPRGTQEGMPFRLFVMLSSGDDLTMPAHPESCTSISYCGLQDKEYPDKREMGYPFNHPLSDSMENLVKQHDTMAWRPFTIRCKNL